MKNRTALASLALCFAASGAYAQSFDVYVSIGDSLAAGFSNGRWRPIRPRRSPRSSRR